MKMKNFKRKQNIKRKHSGFTLMELLVSLAVMLLFTLIMSSLMGTATLAYQKSISCSNADVFISNTVNKLRLELSDARNISLAKSADFSNEATITKYGLSGYTLGNSSALGVFYTDAATGAECLIFYGKKGTDSENLYVSKYGEVNPIVFTTDDLLLKIDSITINEKTVVFNNVRAIKTDDEVYSSINEVVVKLQ